MSNDRKELEKKIMKASSAEEALEILRAAGKEVTAEAAAETFERLKKSQEEMELSLDELDAISGGERLGNFVWIRNYPDEGCRASVEFGSDCYGADGGCWVGNISYEWPPINYKCPDCGVYLYESGPHYARCRVCHKGYDMSAEIYRIMHPFG